MTERLLASAVLAIAVVAGSPVECDAAAFTFQHASGTTPTVFTVYGNVFGFSNILEVTPSGVTFWDHEWPIAELGSWAVLPHPSPTNTGSLAAESRGQLLVSCSGGFSYVEGVGAYDPTSLTAWGGQAMIRAGTFGGITAVDFAGYLNVVGAFTYDETAFLAPITVATEAQSLRKPD